MSLNDDVWSDDEYDYQAKPPTAVTVIHEYSNLEDDDSLVSSQSDGGSKNQSNVSDRIRSNFFRGSVNLHPIQGLLEREKPLHPFASLPRQPPYLPHHIANLLGSSTIAALWKAFLECDANSSGMVSLSKIPEIAVKMSNFGLPFDQVVVKGMGNEDFISFCDCARLLTKSHRLTSVTNRTDPASKFTHQCCTYDACKICRKRGAIEVVSAEDYNDSKTHVLRVTFNRIKIEKCGKFRLKDVPYLMREVKIPYQTSRIQNWDLKTENLVQTFDELTQYIEILRSDKDAKKLDSVDEMIALYALPEWLMAEFKPSEVLLFRHHFSVIDVDKGGSIDAEELVALSISLGNRLTIDQAQNLIDEYDIDGNGSVDFTEFMMLMFKIQRGTINLEGNSLAQSMIEARAQLKIFEEIEDFQRNPPPGAEIKHYGELPIVMDVNIAGPVNSPYENGSYLLRIVFLEGYPYKAPEVKLLTRIYCVNAVTQFDGAGLILHIKYLWNCTWTLSKLVSHVMDLLKEPDFSLLPQEMNTICDFYVNNRRAQEAAIQYRLMEEKLEQERQITEAKALEDALAAEAKNDGSDDAPPAEAVESAEDVDVPPKKTKKSLDDWSDDSEDDAVVGSGHKDTTATAITTPRPVAGDGIKGIDSPRNLDSKSSKPSSARLLIASPRSHSKPTSARSSGSPRAVAAASAMPSLASEGKSDVITIEVEVSQTQSLYSLNSKPSKGSYADEDKKSAKKNDRSAIELEMEALFQSLNVLEQRHVNTMIMYKADHQRFLQIAKEYNHNYGNAPLPGGDRPPTPAAAEEVVDDGYGNDNYYYDEGGNVVMYQDFYDDSKSTLS